MTLDGVPADDAEDQEREGCEDGHGVTSTAIMRLSRSMAEACSHSTVGESAKSAAERAAEKAAEKAAERAAKSAAEPSAKSAAEPAPE